MDKFLKIQSVQGGEITNSDNLRDFNIPMGDVYDLRDSFVQFNCEIERTEAVAGGGTGVYQNMVQWVSGETSKCHFPNSAFVKNCHLKSDTKGNIESIRRNDILKANLHVLGKSQREVADESYLAVNQLPEAINTQQYPIFGSFNKVGAVKSIESKNVPLAISLSDLFDFCATDEYDTNRGGGLRAHMELNRDKLEAVQTGLTAQSVPANFRRFTNVATSAGVGNTLVVGTGTTQLRVLNLDQSPYYVGQKVLITATGTGTGGDKPADITGTNGVAVIKTITWDRGNADQSLGGKMTLTFEENWGVALTGDGGYTDVECTIATCTPTLKITGAELVLKKKNRGDMNNYSQIEYTTYSTEEGFGNSRTSFQDLFTVEGDATQAMMMFAQGSDNLLSSAPLSSFRCALNNIDVTDRDVAVASPLYYDRLASTLRGQGINLRDLKQNAGGSNNFTYADLYNSDTNNVKPLVASLFQTSQNKFLQVKADVGTITYAGGAKSGVNDYQLFKAIPKVFAY
jgi:hypothetical protein